MDIGNGGLKSRLCGRIDEEAERVRGVRALPAKARMMPRRSTMSSGPEAAAELPVRSSSPMKAAVMPSQRASISADPRPAPSRISPMASESSCGRRRSGRNG